MENRTKKKIGVSLLCTIICMIVSAILHYFLGNNEWLGISINGCVTAFIAAFFVYDVGYNSGFYRQQFYKEVCKYGFLPGRFHDECAKKDRAKKIGISLLYAIICMFVSAILQYSLGNNEWLSISINGCITAFIAAFLVYTVGYNSGFDKQ